ncbi:MAG: hypothetical protein AABZ74_15340 [Cyanobacteriota bacterium]
MGFVEKIKKEMTLYKEKTLKIQEWGKWRNEEFSHILPKDLSNLNLIEVYREECEKYLEINKIKFHQNFNHLNSSQALCFNLFFPFVIKDIPISVLFKTLNIKLDDKEAFFEFEKIADKKEGTNFDFYIKTEKRNIYFEVKYTENSFGKARNDENHIKKFNDIYKRKLNGIVKEEYINQKEMFENYQLFRNISYLTENDIVIFVFPKNNIKVKKELKEFRNKLENKEFINKNIVEIEIENIIKGIKEETQKSNNIEIWIKQFTEKYIL